MPNIFHRTAFAPAAVSHPSHLKVVVLASEAARSRFPTAAAACITSSFSFFSMTLPLAWMPSERQRRV